MLKQETKPTTIFDDMPMDVRHSAYYNGVRIPFLQLEKKRYPYGETFISVYTTKNLCWDVAASSLNQCLALMANAMSRAQGYHSFEHQHGVYNGGYTYITFQPIVEKYDEQGMPTEPTDLGF